MNSTNKITFSKITTGKTRLLSLIMDKAEALFHIDNINEFQTKLQAFIDTQKLSNYPYQPNQIYILSNTPYGVDLFKSDCKETNGSLLFLTTFRMIKVENIFPPYEKASSLEFRLADDIVTCKTNNFLSGSTSTFPALKRNEETPVLEGMDLNTDELTKDQIELFYNTRLNSEFTSLLPFFDQGRNFHVVRLELCSTASDGSTLKTFCTACSKKLYSNLGGYFYCYIKHNSTEIYNILCDDCGKKSFYDKFDFTPKTEAKKDDQYWSDLYDKTPKINMVKVGKLTSSKMETLIIAEAKQNLQNQSLYTLKDNLDNFIKNIKPSNHIKAEHVYELIFEENSLLLVRKNFDLEKTTIYTFTMAKATPKKEVQTQNKPVLNIEEKNTATPVLEEKPKKQISVKPSELPKITKRFMQKFRKNKTFSPTFQYGRNSSGVSQFLINHVPPVKCMVSLFLGNGLLLDQIKSCETMVAFAAGKNLELNNDSIKVFASDYTKNLDWINPVKFGKTLVFINPPALEINKQPKLINTDFTSQTEHETLLQKGVKFPTYVMVLATSNNQYDGILLKAGFTKIYLFNQSIENPKTDCIYINYPVPEQLHDYSFVGQNYRDRDNNKKFIKRTIKQLAEMSPLRRNLIIDTINNTTF